MWKEIGEREFGKISARFLSNRIRSNRIPSLGLSNRKEILTAHRGSINSLQVDLTEGRYLLSGAADASVAVYDIQRASSDHHGSDWIAKHSPSFVVDKRHENGHKYAISSAIWYPIDTGLFITGSYDHLVNVWDTNTTQVIMNFKMPGKVYRAAMSSLATSHMLIATGTEDVQVRLCDIASGAFSHTLSGHRDGVMSVEWSTSNEWVLITGGCDGAIRFWDIRQAGCFLVLNQSHTQFGRRPPIPKPSSVNKASTSKPSSGSQSSVKARTPLKKAANGNSSKHPIVGKVHNQAKGSVSKRLHPGMLSSQDRATAHYGSVIALNATKDGMYLLSAGSDSRLRLWDIESGNNTLVNYETARLQSSKPVQLATSQDSASVFVPCMSSVKMFDIWSGKTILMLKEHYDNVNCCLLTSDDQELYTGGNDRQILVWTPTDMNTVDPVELRENNEGQLPLPDEDNWSD